MEFVQLSNRMPIDFLNPDLKVVLPVPLPFGQELRPVESGDDGTDTYSFYDAMKKCMEHIRTEDLVSGTEASQNECLCSSVETQ